MDATKKPLTQHLRHCWLAVTLSCFGLASCQGARIRRRLVPLARRYGDENPAAGGVDQPFLRMMRIQLMKDQAIRLLQASAVVLLATWLLPIVAGPAREIPLYPGAAPG